MRRGAVDQSIVPGFNTPDAALTSDPGHLTAAQVDGLWHLVFSIGGRLFYGITIGGTVLDMVLEGWEVLDPTDPVWQA